MLDSDLAQLYEVKTKVLNQTVRRNEKRFPGDDFMFQLTAEEYNSLRSQFVTLEKDENPVNSSSSLLEGSLRSQNATLKGKHRKFLPTVFTESGAIMLSGVLNSDRAIEINVAVVKAFVEFRRNFNARSPFEERMEQLEKKVDQIGQKYDQATQDILSAIQQFRPGALTSESQQLSPSHSSTDFQTEIRKSENPAFGKNVNNMVEAIQKEVSQYYGIKVQDLTSSARVRTIAVPRQIAIYLIRKHTQLSFKDIGKIFGGKDHTTVMHAFEKVKASLAHEGVIQENVSVIEKYLRKNG